MALTKLKSSGIADGAVTAAQIASGAVPATDTTGLRNDIATLALHSAIADNKAAYNLSNAFIDQFEDDTGLDVQTDCDRNLSEYMATVAFAANATLTLTNGSGTAGQSSDYSKFGGYSLRLSNNGSAQDSITSSELNGIVNAPGTGDWTIDLWVKYSTRTSADRFFSFGDTGGSTSPLLTMGYNGSTSMNFYHSGTDSNSTYPTQDTSWHHYALQHDDSDNKIYHWYDGIFKGDFAFTGNITESTTTLRLGRRHDAAGEHLDGYIDEWRLSNTKRYTNSVNFSVPTVAHSVDSNTCLLFHFDDANPTTEAGSNVTTNATGNYTSATQTAVASVSSIGIVVLYKNNAGVATLNSDIVVAVSANGGTNYTNVTLVAGGTFSTGINIAAVSGVSVTAGTTLKYRISFANQVFESKETQVHGVALLY